MADNLLVTKLFIPSPTPNHAPRLRLFKLLDEGLRLECRLTLISAPAGYGKTTLISEWIHFRKLPSAWLSLDEGDNDPIRFLSYIFASITTAEPAIGDLTLAQASPGESLERHLVTLINRLANLPDKLLIVLDDYHVIHNQSIHDALSYFIENLPPHIQVIIATRADPPLPMARLRARGMLNELRMYDLRFTSEETALLLNQILGFSLSPEDIAGLDRRIEGWAAGLHMLALTLDTHSLNRDASDLSGFIRSFTGSTHYILDFFVEEVLKRQPEAILTFLQQTSILERLCGPLCDAVTGTSDWSDEQDELDSLLQAPLSSGKILEYLAHANLFIVPLDDRQEWYRYHRLFADLLKQRMHLLQPENVPILHQRASIWYEQQQLFDEAIQHAFEADDLQRAADLIEAIAESTLMRSEMATFIGWLEKLPQSEIIQRPNLIVYQSLTLLWVGATLVDIEGKLALIEQSQSLVGKDVPIRAFIALTKGQVSNAMDYCRQALELIPESETLLRGLVELMQAICHMVDGDVQTGTSLLENAAKVNQQTGNLMVAGLVLYQLAELRQKEGQLRQAQALYEQVLEFACDEHGNYLPIAGRALIGLGEIEWAWNDLEAAQGHVLEGIDLSEKWSQISAFDGYLALVAIRLSQGDIEGAERAMEILRNIAQKYELTEIDELVANLIEARIRLAQGDLVAARQWVIKRGLDGLPGSDKDEDVDNIISQRLYKYEILTVARLLFAEGRYDEVIRILDQQLNRLDQIDRPILIIESEVLRALAFQEKKEIDHAFRALEHAIILTEPEGLVRIFVDAGDKMKSLLVSVRLKLQDRQLITFVDQLLLAFSPHKRQVQPDALLKSTMLIEPLSQREIEVLHLLPSSLSTSEMADELYISIHTLRSHLKNIYGKLGVHSRYEAISRAQQLGLL